MTEIERAKERISVFAKEGDRDTESVYVRERVRVTEREQKKMYARTYLL